MKKINIIIINGKPRSGKDTVIGYMKKYCDINECARCYSYSTIDPVKDVLRNLGWNGEKTDEVRNMLSSMKQFWINTCDGPLKYCMDTIFQCMNMDTDDDMVLVFQIREPDEIHKLINAIKPIELAYNLNVSTLLVYRSEASQKHHGNKSDNDVAEYVYDKSICNNSSIEDLWTVVKEYMDNLLEVYKDGNK